MSTPNKLCIVVPVLNEHEVLQNKLEYFQNLRRTCALVFVDGNSSDQTVTFLHERHFDVITAPIRGRGAQISYGASHCPKDCKYLLFLHADTELPNDFNVLIDSALSDGSWGRFEIRLNSNKLIFKIIQLMMNFRSRITNIATGDQGIFVKRDIFVRYSNDVKDHPLMEDIFLSKTLKKNHGSAKIIKQPIIASNRYWIRHGVIRTIIRMWAYRLLYYFGMSPKKLYQRYYRL